MKRRPEGTASVPLPSAERPAQSSSVGFLLSQLGFATAAGFREALAPLDLEPQHWATLRALGANEGQSQQMVCGVLQIPPSRMVGLVDDLESRRLVERRLNATDRRARAVYLTDAGRELLERAVARAIEFEQWICGPLEAEEREQLISLLNRVADRFGLHPGVHPHFIAGNRSAGWACDVNGDAAAEPEP